MVIFLIKLALSDWQEWSDTLKKTNLQTGEKKEGGKNKFAFRHPWNSRKISEHQWQLVVLKSLLNVVAAEKQAASRCVFK